MEVLLSSVGIDGIGSLSFGMKQSAMNKKNIHLRRIADRRWSDRISGSSGTPKKVLFPQIRSLGRLPLSLPTDTQIQGGARRQDEVVC